jgi:hypothetical protein
VEGVVECVVSLVVVLLCLCGRFVVVCECVCELGGFVVVIWECDWCEVISAVVIVCFNWLHGL